jgi:hypothetical protein
MLERTLPVKRYVYDVKVIFQTFTSLKNNDDWPGEEDEYRIDVHVSATGHSPWTFSIARMVNLATTIAINQENFLEHAAWICIDLLNIGI